MKLDDGLKHDYQKCWDDLENSDDISDIGSDNLDTIIFFHNNSDDLDDLDNLDNSESFGIKTYLWSTMIRIFRAIGFQCFS